MNLIETVEQLNQDLFEKAGETAYQFEFSTTGYVDCISFGGHVLWCSESEGREWIEGTNNYEPLVPYVKKKFNAYANHLSKLKF